MGKLHEIFGSWQLVFFRLFIRLIAGGRLSRLRQAEQARAHFAGFATRFRLPDVVHLSETQIRFDKDASVDDPGVTNPGVSVGWVAYGRPDRRKIILHLHGGAFVMGSACTHRLLAAELSRATGMRVAMPNYALAPEHPFPQGLTDALTAWRGLLAAGYDARDMVISGDSAGGGLALSLLLQIQALGLPQPAAMVLFSPWVDLTLSGDSLHRNASRDVLVPIHQARRVVDMYLGDHLATDPLASPLFGAFKTPPPMMIFCSMVEGLLDDSQRMADRLRDAGADVTLERWRSTPHAWVFLGHYLPEAVQALGNAGHFIRKHLRERA